MDKKMMALISIFLTAGFIFGSASREMQNSGMICYKPMPVQDRVPFVDCTKDPENCSAVTHVALSQSFTNDPSTSDPDLAEVEALADQDEPKKHIEP